GKEIEHELPDHHVGVGDGERATASVAGWPGIGARGGGPDAKARAVIEEDRSTPCRDGMDQHHWSAHAHATDHAFECSLIHAGEVADIGRGAAHVEADDARKACNARRLHGADYAARGS